MPLDRIGPADVAAWFDAASGERPGAANRAFEILRAMMFRAEEWGWCERGSNPCLGIRPNRRNKIARFLDADELERPGRALDACSMRNPVKVITRSTGNVSTDSTVSDHLSERSDAGVGFKSRGDHFG